MLFRGEWRRDSGVLGTEQSGEDSAAVGGTFVPDIVPGNLAG